MRTLKQTNSSSAVETLAAAISYEHHVNGFESPTTNSETLSTFIKGARKAYGKPREPVEPLTLEHLHAMIDHLYSDNHGLDGLKATLVLWRTVWLANMDFYGLFCFGDLQLIKRSDLTFVDKPEPHLLIKIAQCKNDIYREGTEKLIAANAENSRYCPVNLTINYLIFLGTEHSGFMLPTCSPKDRFKGNPDKCVHYTLALEDFRNLMNSLGYDGVKFGLHSGKRGGATHAAEAGMS